MTPTTTRKRTSRAKLTVREIDRSVWGDHQDHRLAASYEIGDYKVRISIKLDASYPGQSRLSAKVWRPDQCDWSTVATLIAGESDYVKPESYSKTATAALRANEQVLLKRTCWALGV